MYWSSSSSSTATPLFPGFDTLERLASFSGSMLGAFSFALPERRPPDALTQSHERAAERVHQVATWLLRGSELQVVETRTPFLCENSSDLWDYYQTLPLDRRLDGLFGLLLSIEMLASAGILSREQFPRLRRLLDGYSFAIGVAGVMPCRLFFHMHNWIWAYEYRLALREAKLPQMPMPFATEAGAAILKAVEDVRHSFGLSLAPSSQSSSYNSSGLSVTMTLFLTMCIGVGGAAWWLGLDGIKRKRDEVSARWSQFLRSGLWSILRWFTLQASSTTLSLIHRDT